MQINNCSLLCALSPSRAWGRICSLPALDQSARGWQEVLGHSCFQDLSTLFSGTRYISCGLSVGYCDNGDGQRMEGRFCSCILMNLLEV